MPPLAVEQEPGRLPRGAAVGRYVVISLVGKGGMGVVYAAYDPELGRRVALKLLRAERIGPDSEEEARLRLVAEAQAMARLSHENVISVYDVGTFAGQVFVTMEYVDGPTLRALTDRARPWPEVVALFVQAGRGLAAAHRAGLVHRDFKPQNVLVSRDGRARVLDFGLARPSDSAPRRARLVPDQPLGEDVTETGAIVGTPAYMAPEQLAGRAATAASDQWSFAVALWEALWGARPFIGASVGDLHQAIRARRFTAPAWGQAPAWLRAVLERALAVDPARRYPSMNALLEALGRDPGVRRRRLAAAAAFTAALGLGAAGVTRLAGRGPEPCGAAGDGWSGVWDGARRAQVAAALRASGSLRAEPALREVGRILDGYASAWSAERIDACADSRVRGRQTEAQMEQRFACLDEQRAGVAALIELLVSSGADAATAGRATEAAAALPPPARCGDARALAPPAPADPRRAQARRLLEQARAFLAMARFEEASRLARSVADSARAIDDRALAADALLTAGDAEGNLGKHEEALHTFDEAIWAGEASHRDETVASAWILMMNDAGQLGRLEEGRRYGRLAVAAVTRLGTPADLEADRLEHWARLLELGDAGDEADAARRQALAFAERTLGPASLRVARELVHQAGFEKRRGHLAEARAALERALPIYEAVLGAGHPALAAPLAVLASVLQRQGHLDEALAMQRRALALEEASDPTSLDVAVTVNNLGNTFNFLGKPAAAEPMFRRARAIFIARYGAAHPSVAKASAGLARCLRLRGNLPEAEALYREVLAALPADGAEAMPAVVGLAQVLWRRGRLAEAEREARRALAMVEEAHGADSPLAGDPWFVVGQVLEAQGKPAAALDAYQRALALVIPLDNALQRAEVRFSVARAMFQVGRDRPRALELAAQARAELAAAGPGAAKDLAEVESFLARPKP